VPGTITVRPGLPDTPGGRRPATDGHDDFWSEADATGRGGGGGGADGPGGKGGGTTSGGLTRRVRGAQMPNKKAPRIRRRSQDLPVTAPPADDGSPVDAGDVYGFLTSFTSGVQRGLDDARSRDDGTTGGP
jgi:hypothetical protein